MVTSDTLQFYLILTFSFRSLPHFMLTIKFPFLSLSFTLPTLAAGCIFSILYSIQFHELYQYSESFLLPREVMAVCQTLVKVGWKQVWLQVMSQASSEAERVVEHWRLHQPLSLESVSQPLEKYSTCLLYQIRQTKSENYSVQVWSFLCSTYNQLFLVWVPEHIGTVVLLWKKQKWHG